MPGDEPFDPRERPTEPDLESFPCPRCADEHGEPQGKIYVTTWVNDRQHSTMPDRCPACLGAKRISRERLAWLRSQPP